MQGCVGLAPPRVSHTRYTRSRLTPLPRLWLRRLLLGLAVLPLQGQRLLLEHGVGVEGLELDHLVLDHRHVLAAGLLAGLIAASHAKLPAPPAKSDAEKKADADKAAATKAKDAEDLGRAQDKVVANYKKNKGVSMAPSKPAKK